MKSLSFKTAFTMIELIFVIVVLGILAAVAVPRLAATRDDAQIAKIKSQVATIQTGIATTRGIEMVSGVSGYPPLGENFEYITSPITGWTATGGEGTNSKDKDTDSRAGKKWAGNVVTLTSPPVSGKVTTFKYYRVSTKDGKNDYKAGTFTCDPSWAGNTHYCNTLIK